MFKFFSNHRTKRTTKYNDKNLVNIYKKRNKMLHLVNRHATPLFIIDQEVLKRNLKQLESSCKKNWGPFKIAYSFKTNYEVCKDNFLKKYGVWAEVVSEWEYKMAIGLGYKGKEIIYNGPAKNHEVLKTALGDEALVIVENFQELDDVLAIAIKNRRKYGIGVRLNLESRSVPTRFGFSIKNNEATHAIKQVIDNPFLELIALHVHTGSDVDDVEKFKNAAENLADFLNKNHEDLVKLKIIDFGGGFPSSGMAPYGHRNWNPRSINEYVVAITAVLSKVFKKNRPTLIFEPGRYLVDDAEILITKIINSKESGLRQTLTVDAALTMLPLVQYRPQIINLYDRKLKRKNARKMETIVYGASPRENDVLFKGLLPKAEIGDYLVYFVVGAYNQSMSSDFVFGKVKTVSI